ncbi:deoxynucleoside kinase [Candidatus Woesearchaeota archaeon]|nr:deoxynucleoside kinase [Candidatus Woesearchaeota archaeon]
MIEKIPSNNKILKEYLSNKNCLLAVAGNIGSGKTSLAKLIENTTSINSFYEEIAENPILSKFYEDKKKYSFELQRYLLGRRIQDYISFKKDNNSAIFDRSIYEDPLVFAKSLNHFGYLSNEEHDQYFDLFKKTTKNIKQIDLLILLQISPQHSYDNIHSKRQRDMELQDDADGTPAISLSYIKHLDDFYKDYLVSLKKYNWSPKKTIIIDRDNLDFVNNQKDQKYVIKKISKILTS